MTNPATTDLDDLPVADVEVDADPAVRDLEVRVAAGDDTVTADQLATERAAATGRARFAKLREVAARRAARRDAEQAEAAAAAAALDHARAALAPYSDVAIVEAHRTAVAAVRALAELLDGRNETITRLARLPQAQRVRGANPGHLDAWAVAVPVDGVEHRIAHVGQALRQTFTNGRVHVIGEARVEVEGLPQHPHSERLPDVVAEAEARLAAGKGRRGAA